MCSLFSTKNIQNSVSACIPVSDLIFPLYEMLKSKTIPAALNADPEVRGLLLRLLFFDIQIIVIKHVIYYLFFIFLSVICFINKVHDGHNHNHVFYICCLLNVRYRIKIDIFLASWLIKTDLSPFTADVFRCRYKFDTAISGWKNEENGPKCWLCAFSDCLLPVLVSY